MILGVAGKACSGKNAAASLLEKRGFRSVDLDSLGHRALEEKAGEIAARFGAGLLTEDKRINRKKLGAIVFKNRGKLKELEAIVHPLMFKMLETVIGDSPGENLVINGAVLGKAAMDVLCDRVLWIDCPLTIRIKRAFKRDGNKIIPVFSRIRSQRDLTVQHFSSGVDIYMVRNRGNLTDLENQIESFLQFPEKYMRV